MKTTTFRLPAILLFALLAFALVAFAAACGGDDDDGGGGGGGSGVTPGAEPTEEFDIDDDDFDYDSGSDRWADSKAGDIDLCPMLTDEEAAEVGAESGLGGAGATYTVTREKGEYTAEQQSIRPRSSCRFVIDASSGLAVIQVVVEPADGYESLYKPGGTPIAGLGDDAVNKASAIYVRVGDLMLSVGESSVTSEFTIAIMRKIAPDLE